MRFDDDYAAPLEDDTLWSRLDRIADARELADDLAEVLNPIDSGGGRYRPEKLRARIFREAYDLARAGDLDGARHRLSLYFEPKFGSLEDCQQRYRAAMAAKAGGCA